MFLQNYKNNVNINDKQEVNKNHDIYLVDVDFVDKKISIKINEFFYDIETPLIYFLLPKEYKTALIQLAFMLDSKSIITVSQDTTKAIAKIDKDYERHTQQNKVLSLGNNLVNHHSYMIYKNSEFSYASQQLLKDLGCKTMQEVHKKVSKHINIDDFFIDEEPVKRLISRTLDKNSVFFIKGIRSDGFVLISFELNNDYEPKQNTKEYISTRLSFIELLKDKILEKMVSDKDICIMTIDLYGISKVLSLKDEEIFIKKFLFEVELIIDSKLILAQYDDGFFTVLFENISFKNMQKKAQNYYLQMMTFFNKHKVEHEVSIYVINIPEAELEPVLTTIDAILEDDFSKSGLDKSEIKYINDFQKDMDTQDTIKYLLDTIYTNNNDLKLVNIYDGMCINTSSKIVKQTDELIYVKVEPLQGFVIDLDKTTVLQSSVIAKSIKANVKYICNKENYAILSNFKMLDYNPNERLHGRVKSAKVIPIVISLTGSKVKGVVIDISAKSIAIKLKKTKLMKHILNQEINFMFYIEDIRKKGESIKIEENAVVVYESSPSETGYVKLVCIFNEDMESEAVLIDYIFNRQKSIIQNIKYMITRNKIK